MNNKLKKIINKKNKSKIVCLTAYSKNIAEIVDNHADIVLVGDSLGSVLYNYNTTRKVNLKMMIEHTKSVRMGVKKSLLVIDMPYNTYRNKSEALKNSKLAIKETNCDAVKVEGGVRVGNIVRHLVKNKVPVMGHIGITPQTIKGKFKSVGKTEKERKKLFKDAKALEDNGAFAIVLECTYSNISKKISQLLKIPTIGIGASVHCDGQVLECTYSDISKKISKLVKIPTIGIGASIHCDGQVLVTDDILGLTDAKIKFVKKYVNIKKIINSAILKFKSEVKSKKYPTKKYSY